MAYQGARLVVQVIAAAILAPADFGIWGLVVVILMYTTHANLGILSAANRDIPILLGAERASDAERVEGLALGGSIMAGVVAAILAGIAALAAGGGWTAIALPLVAAILAQQVYLAFQVSLRARLDFFVAGAQQSSLAVAVLVGGTALVLAAGLVGLTWAQALAFALGVVIVLPVRRMARARVEVSGLGELVRVGAPIMLSGLAYVGATTIDRWVVAATGDADDLGAYALASTLGAGLLFLSLLVAQQAYPRMAMAYGAGASPAALRRLAVLQGGIAALVVAIPAVVLIVGAPIVIPWLLPAYEAATAPLQVLSLAYLVLAAGSGFSNLLVTVGRAWSLLVIQLATMVLGAVLGVVAMGAGIGLVGVAGAMLVAYVLFVAASVAVGSRER